MTILFEPHRQWSAHLAGLLGPGVHTASQMEDLQRLLDEQPTEPLVLFGPGAGVQLALDFASQQRLARPTLGVLLLREQLDVETMGQALRAGVREVIEARDIITVKAACERSMEVSRHLAGAVSPAAAAAANARVVTVFSAKGGCGKSTLATNVALALAAGGQRRVCLVDLDLAFGDVGIMLQLAPERGIADAVSSERVDGPFVRALLTPYAPGVEVLLAPVGPTEAERISKDLVVRVLGAIRTLADFIVVDTPAQFSDHVLAALDLSDVHLLVATPDIPALKNLRIAMDMLDLLGLPKESRVVVLNRSDARVGLTGTDIDRVLQTPTGAHVPSSRDVPISINRGVPIVVDKPNHPVSRAIRELAIGRIATRPRHHAGGRIRERLARGDKR